MKRLILFSCLSVSLNSFAQIKISQMTTLPGSCDTCWVPVVKGTANYKSRANQLFVVSGYVPTSRVLTINGVNYDLSANRSWTITAAFDTTYIYNAISLKTNKSTTITINGVTHDLSANRTWTVVFDTTDVSNFSVKVRSLFSPGYALQYGNGVYSVDSAALSLYVIRRKDSLTTTNPLGYVTKKVLEDTAAAIRAAFPAGGSGSSLGAGPGIDTTGGKAALKNPAVITSTNYYGLPGGVNGLESVQYNTLVPTVDVFQDGGDFFFHGDTLFRVGGWNQIDLYEKDSIQYSTHEGKDAWRRYWKTAPTIFGNCPYLSERYHGDAKFIAGNNGYDSNFVIRFHDAGDFQVMSWHPEYGSRRGFGMARDVYNNLYVIGGQSNRSDSSTAMHDVWMSTNDGKNWTRIQTNTPFGGGEIINSTPDRDGWLYVLDADSKFQVNCPGCNLYKPDSTCWKIRFTDMINGDNKWIRIDDCPYGMSFRATANFRGLLFMHGGYAGINSNITVYLDKDDHWHELPRFYGIDSASLRSTSHAGFYLVYRDMLLDCMGNSRQSIDAWKDTIFLSPFNVRNRLGVGAQFAITTSLGNVLTCIGQNVEFKNGTDSIFRTTTGICPFTIYGPEGIQYGILDTLNSLIGVPVIYTTANMMKVSKDYHQIQISNPTEAYLFPGQATLLGYGHFIWNGLIYADSIRVEKKTGRFSIGTSTDLHASFSEVGSTGINFLLAGNLYADPVTDHQYRGVSSDAAEGLYGHDGVLDFILGFIPGPTSYGDTYKVKLRMDWDGNFIPFDFDNLHNLGLVGSRWHQLHLADTLFYYNPPHSGLNDSIATIDPVTHAIRGEDRAHFVSSGGVTDGDKGDVVVSGSGADWAVKPKFSLQIDTIPLATFTAGARFAGDTAAFDPAALYGSFYNSGSDTLDITALQIGLQGTSPSVNVVIYFNDSLGVTAGATALVNAGTTVTDIYTGTTVTSLDNKKIPSGNWVWVQTPTVTTKPTYLSVTLVGHKIRNY